MERFVEPALDYTRVRTLADFERWAIEALTLPETAFTQRSIASVLFDLLNVPGQELVVLEVGASQMSNQMRELMADSVNGLYSVLGFHLPREGNNAIVRFRRQDER
jgi:hypothetical protein